MDKKIILTIFFSILVAFGIFYFTVSFYQETYNPTKIWTEYIVDKFDLDKEKIFIFGNSHVGSINPLHVEEKLNEKNFQVFNLSVGGDDPRKRENTINSIINLEPSIVVYGIDFRSFEAQASARDIQAVSSSGIDKIENILPSFQEYFDEILIPVKNNEVIANFPPSPKIITLRILNHIVHGSPELERLNLDAKRPLITDEPVGIKAINSTQLEKDIQSFRAFRGIPDSKENFPLISLHNILDKFSENNVKIIIFTTPHHRTYLDYLSEEDKKSFDVIIKDLEKKYDLKIYRLDSKYKDYEIFGNPTHVAIETSENYSNDIFEMIKSETSN